MEFDASRFGGGGESAAPDATTVVGAGEDDGFGKAHTIFQRDGAALNIWEKAPYIIWSSINRADLNKAWHKALINSGEETDRYVVRALNLSWYGNAEE